MPSDHDGHISDPDRHASRQRPIPRTHVGGAIRGSPDGGDYAGRTIKIETDSFARPRRHTKRMCMPCGLRRNVTSSIRTRSSG